MDVHQYNWEEIATCGSISYTERNLQYKYNNRSLLFNWSSHEAKDISTIPFEIVFCRGLVLDIQQRKAWRPPVPNKFTISPPCVTAYP